MRPDISAFKACLVIGNVPTKYPMPTLYDGLKKDVQGNIFQFLVDGLVIVFLKQRDNL